MFLQRFNQSLKYTYYFRPSSEANRLQSCPCPFLQWSSWHSGESTVHCKLTSFGAHLCRSKATLTSVTISLFTRLLNRSLGSQSSSSETQTGNFITVDGSTTQTNPHLQKKAIITSRILLAPNWLRCAATWVPQLASSTIEYPKARVGDGIYLTADAILIATLMESRLLSTLQGLSIDAPCRY